MTGQDAEKLFELEKRIKAHEEEIGKLKEALGSERTTWNNVAGMNAIYVEALEQISRGKGDPVEIANAALAPLRVFK